MRELTQCVVNPPLEDTGFASLSVPTFRASTIVFDNAQQYAERSKRGPDGYTYGLHGTPTTRALEARITALEGGVRTALMPSGQAAIAVVLLTVLRPGDSVLVPDTVYPPVRGLAENFLKDFGIRYDVYDPCVAAGISDLIGEHTRLVWVESPGSTSMEIQDVPAIVAAAKAKGVLVGCDNTWATPLYFKPLAHGVDFSMEAITKYVGGHSDLLMGSVSVSTIEMHRRLKATMRMLGMGVSPDDCFLALRGLETMGVRLTHAGKTALALAEELCTHPAVEQMLHPGLPSCPGHALWKRDFSGSSGVFSIVLKDGCDQAIGQVLDGLKVFRIGASWGGTHSLIAPMSIAKDRALSNWSASSVILRVSIGLEDPEDLREDLLALLEGVISADVPA
ncbi:MAG: cystathionine beta-lyase [Pusillimonas sp.]